MSLYTKKGDGGETGLPGGRRLAKTEAIFEVLGTLDEVNAQIGVAVSLMRDYNLQNGGYRSLRQIQTTLFSIGACLAAKDPQKSPILDRLDRLTLALESQIDAWESKLSKLQNFILPGGSPVAAHLHLIRTICRRLERNFQRLNDKSGLAPISRYLNRLSDFFFQAARWWNFKEGVKEKIWREHS